MQKRLNESHFQLEFLRSHYFFPQICIFFFKKRFFHAHPTDKISITETFPLKRTRLFISLSWPDNNFTGHSELPERAETGAAQTNEIPTDKPHHSGQSGVAASSLT